MKTTKYRGYLIAQQKEFGPLRLLKWVEDGDFIIVKDTGNAMPGTTFRTEDDAKKVIEIQLKAFRTFAAG